jgi:hypothetical protein
MRANLRDPLDVQIDEVLAEMMAGEPRRVNAASVRAAIEAQPRRAASRVGPWLAIAAVLVLAFTFGIRTRTSSPGSSLATAGAPASSARPVAEGAAPGSRPETALVAAATFVAVQPTAARRRTGARTPVREELSPFPRLEIASIDRPEPLAFGSLQADALVVARMDIAPLLLTTLNQEQEPHP